jgi:hypothetical protein
VLAKYLSPFLNHAAKCTNSAWDTYGVKAMPAFGGQCQGHRVLRGALANA